MENGNKILIKIIAIILCALAIIIYFNRDMILIRKKNIKPEEVEMYEFDDGSRVKIEGEVSFQVPEDLTLNKDTENIASISIIDKCTILDIKLSGKETYYENSRINDGYARLYVAPEGDTHKNKTITINAGHGVIEGYNEKTYCHPDKSKKVELATESEATYLSYAITDGMTFLDGRSEGNEVLKVALCTRDVLLENGYNVLMIRENNNSRLDNISRAILANEHSDMHISLHFDSTQSNKGMFVIVPIKKKSYIDMEPVKSNYNNILKLSECMIDAWKEDGLKVFQNGMRGEDLTQISYSTVPSIDIEMGDKATYVDDEVRYDMAKAIYHGVENYFKDDIEEIIYDEEGE